MRNEMIFRFGIDLYIYAIDQKRILVVYERAWQAYINAGYGSNTLYNPQFWLQLVGQDGVYIQEPPFPAAFGCGF